MASAPATGLPHPAVVTHTNGVRSVPALEGVLLPKTNRAGRVLEGPARRRASRDGMMFRALARIARHLSAFLGIFVDIFRASLHEAAGFEKTACRVFGTRAGGGGGQEIIGGIRIARDCS